MPFQKLIVISPAHIVYVCIRWSRAEEVAAFVADMAREQGLICFDPQSGELR